MAGVRARGGAQWQVCVREEGRRKAPLQVLSEFNMVRITCLRKTCITPYMHGMVRITCLCLYCRV